MEPLNSPRDVDLALIYGRRPYVTTKLSKPVCSLFTEKTFDQSMPKGLDPFTHYNCLQDPHLKHYFSRSDMKKSLRSGRFITDDELVLTSRKEYNSFCSYLQNTSIRRKAMVAERLTKEWSGYAMTVNQSHKKALEKEPSASVQKRALQRKMFFATTEKKQLEKKKLLQVQRKGEEELKIQATHQNKLKMEEQEEKWRIEAEEKMKKKVELEKMDEKKKQDWLLQYSKKYEESMTVLEKQKEAAKEEYKKKNQERLWRYEKCALGSQKSLEDKIAERLASKQGRVLNRNSTFKALHSHQEESLRRAKELNARKTHLLLREVDIIEKQKKAKMISELLEWRESFQQRMKKSSHINQQYADQRKKSAEKCLKELLQLDPPRFYSSSNSGRKLLSFRPSSSYSEERPASCKLATVKKNKVTFEELMEHQQEDFEYPRAGQVSQVVQDTKAEDETSSDEELLDSKEECNITSEAKVPQQDHDNNIIIPKDSTVGMSHEEERVVGQDADGLSASSHQPNCEKDQDYRQKLLENGKDLNNHKALDNEEDLEYQKALAVEIVAEAISAASLKVQQ